MKSIWQTTAKLPSFPQQKENIRTDVLIIGGGIAGILTAYFYIRMELNMFLLKRQNLFRHYQNTTAKLLISMV